MKTIVIIVGTISCCFVFGCKPEEPKPIHSRRHVSSVILNNGDLDFARCELAHGWYGNGTKTVIAACF